MSKEFIMDMALIRSALESGCESWFVDQWGDFYALYENGRRTEFWAKPVDDIGFEVWFRDIPEPGETVTGAAFLCQCPFRAE